MPTGLVIANRVMTTLGLLEQGGSISTSDALMVMDQLNTMWDSWSVDEGMIYAIVPERIFLVPNRSWYTIGPTASADVPFEIPARIYSAMLTIPNGGTPASVAIANPGQGYQTSDSVGILGATGTGVAVLVTSIGAGGAVTGIGATVGGTGFMVGSGYQTFGGSGTGLTVDINTVSGGNSLRIPIDIVPAQHYFSHRDLTATAGVMNEIYPDYSPDSDGNMRIYVYPIYVPTQSSSTLELLMGVNFTAWTLTSNYSIPPGMQDAINYALAFRLIPIFGMTVSEQVVATITPLAQKAELRIRESNKYNRKLPEGSEILQVPPEAKQGQ